MKAHIEEPMTQAEIAATKAQWLMVVAFNDVLGIGKERLNRVFERYVELANHYIVAQKDDVSDEMLLRRIKQILPDVTKIYRDDGRWVKKNGRINNGND